MFTDHIDLIEKGLILLGLIILSVLVLQGLRYLFTALINRKFSLYAVFRDFGQKIWMTIGLGVFFSGVYFSIVMLASALQDAATRQKIFQFLYQRPVDAIYLGLIVFILISILICLVRMMIKSLYNNSKKGGG